MNMIELKSIMAKCLILGGNMIISYPVVMMDNSGEIKALWFNFLLDENKNDLIILIKTIFIMGYDMELKKINVNIEIKTNNTECDEPPLDEQEYLSLLEKQFTNYNKYEMMKLLSQVEIKPLLIAYETAINYVT